MEEYLVRHLGEYGTIIGIGIITLLILRTIASAFVKGMDIWSVRAEQRNKIEEDRIRINDQNRQSLEHVATVLQGMLLAQQQHADAIEESSAIQSAVKQQITQTRQTVAEIKPLIEAMPDQLAAAALPRIDAQAAAINALRCDMQEWAANVKADFGRCLATVEARIATLADKDTVVREVAAIGQKIDLIITTVQVMEQKRAAPATDLPIAEPPSAAA